MSIVPLLKSPAIYVGWFSADLEWTDLGQLGQLGCFHGLLSPSSLSWASCSDGRGASRIVQGIYSLSLELVRHHFCHIPLAKVSHKASPDPSGREVDPTSQVRRTAVLWQRILYKKGQRTGAISHTNSVPSARKTQIWNYRSIPFSLFPLVDIPLSVFKIFTLCSLHSRLKDSQYALNRLSVADASVIGLF